MIHVYDKQLVEELLTLSPTYKRGPSKGQNMKMYLKEVQPTVNFLKSCNNKTRKFCISLAFSTDGYVSLPTNGKYSLGLTCYHDKLCREWKEIMIQNGLETSFIRRTRSKSGLTGLLLKRNSINLFWKRGGFIPGVKITSKSKSYKGFEKNKLLGLIIKTMGP